jgi:DNA adenine methylase
MGSPFLKMVGGKTRLLNAILPLIDTEMNAYYEPFLGGGAVFFAHTPQVPVFLSDNNPRLIITYRMVRDRVEDLVGELLPLQERFLALDRERQKQSYLAFRDIYNESTDELTIAKLFIFLNQTCYNGLYRLNQRGAFNVPYGNYRSPTICEEANLRDCSFLLQNTELRVCDFTEQPCQGKAFFYLDPPYSSVGFSQSLKAYCKSLDGVRSKFILSSANTLWIRDNYSNFRIAEVTRPGASEEIVTELLISN